MFIGYIHAAIANQWLRKHSMVGILPRSVPVGYAAQQIPLRDAAIYICSRISSAARLTHPTNRLIAGTLRLPEAALDEVVQ